jgi:hypothetical protein
MADAHPVHDIPRRLARPHGRVSGPLGRINVLRRTGEIQGVRICPDCCSIARVYHSPRSQKDCSNDVLREHR